MTLPVTGVALALLIVVLLRHKPAWALLVVQGLIFVAPISVQEYFFPGLHPAALITILYFPLFMLRKPGAFKGRLKALLLPLQALAIVLALFSSQTFSETASGTKLILSVLVAPSLYILMSWSLVKENRRNSRLLLNGFLVFVLLNILVAIAQQLAGRPIFFERIDAGYYSWWRIDSPRRSGLMGSPLDLGLVCAVATPLIATLRSSSVRLLMILALCGGAALAQARVALLLVVIAALWVIVSDGKRLGRSLLPIVGLTFAAVVAARGLGLVSGLSSRFETAAAGDSYRFYSYRWFADNFENFIFFGNGPYSDPRMTGETVASLESTYFSLAYGFGLVFALALLFLYLALATQALRSEVHHMPIFLSSMTFVVAVGLYSGVAAAPQNALILAFVVGAAVITPNAQSSSASKSMGGGRLVRVRGVGRAAEKVEADE